MMKKFLWKGSILGSCFYKVSWKQCCLRKLDGGLGFKELLSWNQCATYLQVWRIIKNDEDSIWLSWFHKHMLRNRAFWTMEIPSGSSWGLQKILKARDKAKVHISYKVGRDSNFLLWHDPWGDSRPVIQILGQRAISSLESTSLARLSSIIRNGQWCLGPSNDLSTIELRHICARATIHDSDGIFWDGIDHRKLKTSDIWDTIRTSGTLPSWFQFVWCKFQVPKFAFTAWLIVLERLLTKDQLIDFRMATDPTCILCGIHNESHAHLFCTCPFVRQIYASWHVGITLDWYDFKAGNLFTNTGLDTIQKEMSFLFISAVLHSIWRERNSRIHDSNHRRSVDNIKDEVKATVREKLFTCKFFIQKARSDVYLLSSIY